MLKFLSRLIQPKVSSRAQSQSDSWNDEEQRRKMTNSAEMCPMSPYSAAYSERVAKPLLWSASFWAHLCGCKPIKWSRLFGLSYVAFTQRHQRHSFH
ncbi:hypothetical protein DPEC_G00360110 [Dallia pectoralis]|uniref:Uncharacterized protein n=1 Tax=Dallia pectoralis TaxID=75939 RepID=A0ACC2F0R7_DALPE|nr:hypothetical protein DPEC_G00360110 [Dallia pectoralis]